MKAKFEIREPGFDALHQVSDGVYTFVTQFLFNGVVPIHNRSVVVHIPASEPGQKGSLAVINPAELHPDVLGALKRMEEQKNAVVRYLISPGDWHYMFMGQHLRAFPEAKAYVPPGRIPSKEPDFEYALIDVEADNPFSDLAPHLIALNVKGLLDFTDPARERPRYELVFFHPESRAITSGDVLYYIGQDELSPMQRSIGQEPRALTFHFAKWGMVKSADDLARSIEHILRWDFDHYISIHGEPGNMLEGDAKAHVERVLAWAKSPRPKSTSARVTPL